MSIKTRTAPFIGGLFAIILDNTIPGTRKERGVDAWAQSSSDEDVEGLETYDIPWLSKITNLSFMKFVPISPAFKVYFLFLFLLKPY